MTAKEFLKQKNIIDIYWIEHRDKGKGIELYKLLDEFAHELKTNCERASRPFEGVVIKLGAELFQFDDYENWCDTAKRKFKKAKVHTNDVICLDTQNRICGWGEHFMKARDENAFPIKCYAIRTQST